LLSKTLRILAGAAVWALAAACPMFGLAAGPQSQPDAHRPPLVLAAGGRSDFALVESAQPSEAERRAVRELADFIRRSTGAALPIVQEKDFKDGRGVYVGQTDFARRHEIDFARLGPEEWIVRAVGPHLIVAGGRPRGTLYGAYEFLEEFAGVRFPDADTELVPKKAALTVPADAAIRKSPAFLRREIYMVGGRRPEQVRFQVRRKVNSFGVATFCPGPEWGFSVRFGSPYTNHGQSYYTKDFPADKPEYFALTAKGTRHRPGGQPCMSHPEVRKLFAARLRRYIEQDRERVVKAGRGEPFPVFYDVSPVDDGSAQCVCERCRAVAGRYGAYGGVVLEFTNAIAEEVAKDYPDVVVQTAAYEYYVDAPRGIRPRDNVMIRIAQLGAEFNVLPRRDTLRGLDHPLNERPRKVHEEWANLGATLGVHDYWTAWSQPFQWPQANIRGLAQTLRRYHRCQVKDFFVEDELFGSRLHNFVDLQFYLATELLDDPEKDDSAVVDEFMALYYGQAAPAMRRLLDYLERRQEEQPGVLATVPPSARRYFDVSFFLETDATLGEAEARVAGDPKRLANVRQERLAIDETMLHLWNKLGSPRPLPFGRPEVVERLRQSYEAAYAKYGGWGEGGKRQDAARLEYLRDMPPIPPQFQGKTICDVCGPQLNLVSEGIARSVDDPQAACGKAWRLYASLAGPAGRHDQPQQFGLYGDREKVLIKQVLAPAGVPKDEKYHFHLVGRMKATATMYFWAHQSWRLSQRLQMVYDSSLPEQKTYDVYASIKLEGPGYVPGSAKMNSFSVDRIILVEVDPP
jgi:hypothetical protein